MSIIHTLNDIFPPNVTNPDVAFACDIYPPEMVFLSFAKSSFPAFQDPATSDWLAKQKSPRTETRRQDAGVMHEATMGPLKAALWEYFQAPRTSRLSATGTATEDE